MDGTAAEITTVSQSVAHVKMFSQPGIISSKDINLASKSMTEGDRRGQSQTASVFCTITCRHVPGYWFPGGECGATSQKHWGIRVGGPICGQCEILCAGFFMRRADTLIVSRGC